MLAASIFLPSCLVMDVPVVPFRGVGGLIQRDQNSTKPLPPLGGRSVSGLSQTFTPGLKRSGREPLVNQARSPAGLANPTLLTAALSRNSCKRLILFLKRLLVLLNKNIVTIFL